MVKQRPEIDLEQVRGRATEQSFERGQDYFNSGAVFDTALRGNDLEGNCTGSSYPSYQMRVRFDEDNDIVEIWCTCPYDWGGDCKHIVALLLTYIDDPDAFEERVPVRDALMARQREDLVDLIQQMVERYPGLAALIDRPSPGQHHANGPIDITPVRYELRQAVRMSHEWQGSAIEWTIDSVTEMGQGFADAGDWRSASAIYRTILEECLETGFYPPDDEGEYVYALNTVLRKLATCLEPETILQDDVERQAVLDKFLYAYTWDIDMGGYGLGDSVLPGALLTYATQGELPAIRQRVMAALQQKMQAEYGRWGAEAYAAFLAELDELEGADVKVTLDRLHEQGMYHLLVEKLLSLGRAADAIAIVSEHITGPSDRLRTLSMFVDAGQDDAAIALARETLSAQYGRRLAYWLAERHQVREEHKALFEVRHQIMNHDPSEGAYASLKAAAQTIGVWKETRPEILQDLGRAQRHPILARVYLHDEEWDAAWEVLDKLALTEDRRPYWGSSLDLEVAERSRHACPQKAIPVYVKHAHRMIGGRQRSSYQQAAAYLVIVRDLYQQIGQEEAWAALIGDIRTEYRRLRALQDELNKAGL